MCLFECSFIQIPARNSKRHCYMYTVSLGDKQKKLRAVIFLIYSTNTTCHTKTLRIMGLSIQELIFCWKSRKIPTQKAEIVSFLHFMYIYMICVSSLHCSSWISCQRLTIYAFYLFFTRSISPISHFEFLEVTAQNLYDR